MIDTYFYVFTISVAIHTYIIYRFMNIFFEKTGINRKIVFITFLLYYILLIFMHFVIKKPNIKLIFNIISLIALTFNYKAPIKKRIISPLLIFIILVLIEILVAAITNFSFTSGSNLSSIPGEILTRIISFIVMLAMENFKNLKKGFYISNIYWLSIVVIPFGTLVICFLLLVYIHINPNHILISISVLLIMNILTFYLFDAINKSYEEKIENLIIKEQNNYYQYQLNLMESSVKNVNSIRHDMKNHLFAISNYIKNNENDHALNYISKIVEFSYGNNEYARSGNIDMDSILNYKLLEAESNGICCELELKIPEELNFESFDMVVVLCNLLDNSIQAVLKLKDNKKINVSIVYKKGVLFIHIENTYDGNVIYENNKIITTKTKKENTGIGLNNVKNVVEKYNGTMDVRHDGFKFTVDIILYIKDSSKVISIYN